MTLLDPADLGTILSVWAHPDDETYLAAGIMAAARDQQRRVVCAVASAGELGTEDPAGWPPERLGPVRRWEAAAAMAVLGVDEHHILGLPDGGLAGHESQGLAWVRGLLDDVRPDTILTFGPEGMTFHDDHVAVHRWVTTVWQERDRSCRLLYATTTVEHIESFRDLYESWGVFMTDQRPAGVPEESLAVLLRLDGVALDRKVAALRAMSTQTEPVLASLGVDGYAALVRDEAYWSAARPDPE